MHALYEFKYQARNLLQIFKGFSPRLRSTDLQARGTPLRGAFEQQKCEHPRTHLPS